MQCARDLHASVLFPLFSTVKWSTKPRNFGNTKDYCAQKIRWALHHEEMQASYKKAINPNFPKGIQYYRNEIETQINQQ